jgi:hypothetical protein
MGNKAKAAINFSDPIGGKYFFAYHVHSLNSSTILPVALSEAAVRKLSPLSHYTF